jgi:hypothetical protein
MTSATQDTHRTRLLFEEEQRFVGTWVMIPVLLVVVLGWYFFVRQIVFGEPVGDRPADDWGIVMLWLVAGILMPLLFVNLKLTVRVWQEEIYIRFSPLFKRTIPTGEVKSCAMRTYRPLLEYGGWGVRCGFRRGMAYNVSGNEGAQLELTNGKKVLIGSQRANELAAAITRAMEQRPS